MREGAAKQRLRSGAHRRTLLVLLSAFAIFAAASSLFTVDVTEYGIVTRFGQVVRVISEPGLYLRVAPARFGAHHCRRAAPHLRKLVTDHQVRRRVRQRRADCAATGILRCAC